MKQILAYLYANKVSIGAFAGLVISSGVKTLPPPGYPFELYTFLYDWSHQFLNITNTRLSTQQIITPPATPEKTHES